MCGSGAAPARVPSCACAQTSGVDAQYTLFEVLHGNYELSISLPFRTCEAVVRAITTKGFDASFLLPLSTVMVPSNEPVKSVQRLVLKSLLDPMQMHGLFSRRQLSGGAGSGDTLVVADVMLRLLRALGIHPQALLAPSTGTLAITTTLACVCHAKLCAYCLVHLWLDCLGTVLLFSRERRSGCKLVAVWMCLD